MKRTFLAAALLALVILHLMGEAIAKDKTAEMEMDNKRIKLLVKKLDSQRIKVLLKEMDSKRIKVLVKKLDSQSINALG